MDNIYFDTNGWLLGGRMDAAPGGLCDKLTPRGVFGWEVIGKDGKLKRKGTFPNGITNDGLNKLLNVMFVAATQLTAWYAGLISNTSYSALAAGDTMSSHAGWTESVAYSGSTRPQWTAGTSTSKSTTNSSTVDFAINADGTVIKGIFITSDNTKSGTSGTLWSTGLFTGDQTLANGDTLKITYTVNVS